MAAIPLLPPYPGPPPFPAAPAPPYYVGGLADLNSANGPIVTSWVGGADTSANPAATGGWQATPRQPRAYYASGNVANDLELLGASFATGPINYWATIADVQARSIADGAPRSTEASGIVAFGCYPDCVLHDGNIFALVTQYKPSATNAATALDYGLANYLNALSIAYTPSLGYVQYGYLNILPTVLAAQYAAVKTIFDAQATALNANPAVQNPQAYIAAQQLIVTNLVNAQIAGATALANSTIAAATVIVNGYKTGTVDPTVATALAQIATQQAFVNATILSAQAQVNAAIVTYTAVVNAQRTALEAEAARQQAVATATVTAAQAQAMALIASTTVTVLALAAQIQAQAAATVAQTLATVGAIVAGVQSQLADRPLYYGALTTPISVTNPTDVIVIPPGGLTITAD